MRSFTRSVAVAVFVGAFALLACKEKNDSPVSFITKAAPIQFSFPAGWHVNPEEHPFDLQCLSRFQEMNTGVFVFHKADVALDSTPTDVLWTQIDDLKAKRKNFEEFGALQKREYEDKTVTSISYLGDKNSKRNCYTFSLIEFRGDDSTFAVALQVSSPGEWKTNKPILEAIVRSARLVPDGG